MRARLLCALLLGSVVSPAGASARAPSSVVPPGQATANASAESSAADAAKAPDVDPSSVCEADAETAPEDEAHLNDEATEAAPSIADLVLANPQVQTMIGLFGRGLTVNEDAVEPPLAPVSVRLRPAKRVGASLAVFVRF